MKTSKELSEAAAKVNNDPLPLEPDPVIDLSNVSDEQLIAELVKRGFSVEISK